MSGDRKTWTVGDFREMSAGLKDETPILAGVIIVSDGFIGLNITDDTVDELMRTSMAEAARAGEL